MKTEESKTVYKPWGKEIWLELNEKYCYKRIYINAGHKTSFQYHKYKRETNYIISGTAEIWLENDNGIVEKFIMNAGDFFNVTPPKKHRVIAITDIILQEVSTPEVDDVFRLEDDTNRTDGKLEHEHQPPAMCIVAAGKGSRLGKLTENFHKSLLPINNKAILSHIIDKTPKEYDIILAIGFNGHLIKEYCEIAHNDRKITFVEVDDYTSENSGPGYSLMKCKDKLQRPFYFITADCIIKENLPLLDGNWIGLAKTSIPELYSTANIDDENNILDFKNKSSEGYENAFIGLCSIFDYNTFWENLEKNMQKGEMVSAFYTLNFKNLKGKFLTWYDIGTLENYIRAKSELPNSNQYGIPKDSGDIIYKINNKFIKYFSTDGIAKKIASRANNLKDITPNLTYCGNYFISYDWIPGKTLYEHSDSVIYENFLNWTTENLWISTSTESNEKLFEDFYKNKTIKRVEMFLAKRDDSYKKNFIINKTYCLNIDEVLSKIDFDKISNGIPTKKFHGDLQFDNIIASENKFTLIDWRPDFGKSDDIGDVYYDLSKIYGGILLPYNILKTDESILEVKFESENEIELKLLNPQQTLDLKMYESWLISKGYDLDRIKMITNIIFLNMAPLHSKKFGNFLYFYSLYRFSNENK